MTDGAKNSRADIQALRGLAVLLVVLYHAKIGYISAGYLGVDIFFVISGFLITTLVANGVDQGEFRLSDFYFRRAKRLLPAAYVTFAVTAALAPWFLSQQELRDFAAQMIGAITFTGNFVLWQQSGYFEGAGDLKPLLHVWSLAIEEQYYFLMPVALLFVNRSRWLSGAVALLLISLGLCIVGNIWKPIATFYLLPTRGWELLIGSVGALWVLRNGTVGNNATHGVIRLLFAPSLMCLILVPFMPINGTHPGLNAFLVCAATLIVILRNSYWLNSAFPTKLLARLGDFSYSLYLVHWPIIAFMKNSWVGSNPEVPLYLRIGTLSLSFLFAYLLGRFVEDPIRKSNLSLSKSLIIKVTVASSLLMLIAPVMIFNKTSEIDFKLARRNNYGFSEACEYNNVFKPKVECQSSSSPTLLIWGDSFAMHLVPGLASQWKGGGVIQATRSQCGPFVGMAPYHVAKPYQGNHIDRAWAESCIAFNDSVVGFLRATPTIETVVLSSSLSQYVTRENYLHLTFMGNAIATSPATVGTTLESLNRTVAEIRALGKKVVLIAPPPSSDFNIGGCLERLLSKAIAIGGSPECTIDRKQYHTTRFDVLAFLNTLRSSSDIPVIRFDPLLCDLDSCKTLINATMIYRDSGHFSYAGSERVGEHMQLGELVRQEAK